MSTPVQFNLYFSVQVLSSNLKALPISVAADIAARADDHLGPSAFTVEAIRTEILYFDLAHVIDCPRKLIIVQIQSVNITEL